MKVPTDWRARHLRHSAVNQGRALPAELTLILTWSAGVAYMPGAFTSSHQYLGSTSSASWLIPQSVGVSEPRPFWLHHNRRCRREVSRTAHSLWNPRQRLPARQHPTSCRFSDGNLCGKLLFCRPCENSADQICTKFLPFSLVPPCALLHMAQPNLTFCTSSGLAWALPYFVPYAARRGFTH